MTLLLALIVGVMVSWPAATATAGDDERVRLVDGAETTLAGFLNEGESARLVRAALGYSTGVLILTNEGTETGVRGWRGLLFERDALGAWTGPAVYTVISGTFGRSPTDQVDRAMLIALTDVERLIAPRIRLGGSGVSVARLAPGRLPNTDLVVVTDATGADESPQESFIGTVLAPDEYATNALYGEPTTVREAVASTANIGDDIANIRLRLDAATGLP